MGGTPVGYFIQWNSTRHKTSNHSTVGYQTRQATLTGLEPDTTYVITVCPTSTTGMGPCARNLTRTLPSCKFFPITNRSFSCLFALLFHVFLRVLNRLNKNESHFHHIDTNKGNLYQHQKHTFTLYHKTLKG